MRSLAAALILLFALPAAAQDMPALFRSGMDAVEAAGKAKDEDRRNEHLDRAIATFRKMLIANPRLVRVRLELVASKQTGPAPHRSHRPESTPADPAVRVERPSAACRTPAMDK